MLEELKCPKCNELYSPPFQRCLSDDQVLVKTMTLVGTVLDKRYRLDKVLGVGGMGAVYRSLHLGYKKEVAVKVMHPEMMQREGMLARFNNEAIALGQIEHKRAVKVTDVGIHEGQYAYLVMELVEGRVLRDLMAQSHGMPYARVVEILAQTCEGIHAAHQKNIIHRDLKPDNIIVNLTPRGEDDVKVLDFGIAKLREYNSELLGQLPQTRHGILIGTPQYMSPEQCDGMRGEELKPTSDIYSLGIIAYEMLTGRTPFSSDTPFGYIKKHGVEPVPPLSVFAKDISPAIERVVLQSLEKEPEKRPQSALEFGEQLRAALRSASQRAAETTHKLRGDERQTLPLLDEQQPKPKPPAPLPQRPSKDPYETAPAKLPPAPQWRERMEVLPVAQSVEKAPTPLPKRRTDDAYQTNFTEKKWRLRTWQVVVVVALIGAIAAVVYFMKLRPVDSSATAETFQSVTDEFGEQVLLPGGTFTMGSSEVNRGDLQPHQVTLKPFWLDKYEVTNKQYQRFVEVTGYPPPLHWTQGGNVAELPVTHVTWKDAVAYANWAKKRLPTEEEWEYAARSGDRNFLYPWGNDWRDEFANIGLRKEPVPVISKLMENDKNRFGVFGLAGNVSEWVADEHRRYDNNELVHKDRCPTCRVFRGGNFAGKSTQSKATDRFSLYPEPPKAAEEKDAYEKALRYIGFRCAKDQ